MTKKIISTSNENAKKSTYANSQNSNLFFEDQKKNITDVQKKSVQEKQTSNVGKQVNNNTNAAIIKNMPKLW